jgi:hypothetical protein
MKNRALILVAFPLLIALFAARAALGGPAASAAPAVQLTDFPTPTPGADGRILYVVQSGDTLWRIAAVSGVPLEELRLLNNMGVDDVLVAGQTILLGIGGPAVTPTQEIIVTPLENLTPSPTPSLNTGNICVLLFLDANGDSLRQEEELSIEGGAVSVTERLGNFSETRNTELGDVEVCFEAIPAGEYNVTVAIPDGYNPTTQLSATVQLDPGVIKNLRMGAQVSAGGVADILPVQEGGRSPLLGILGLALVLAGGGVGFIAVQRMR